MSETMFYILSSLRQERHGYGIMLHVKEITQGRIVLGAGTIYQTLQKLERDRLIRPTREIDRKKQYHHRARRGAAQRRSPAHYSAIKACGGIAMKNTKTVWFSAYRWVVPADYEAWLETLAKQGWNLQRIRQWDSIRMTFHKTEPKQYRYVFDLNAFPKKDYKATYQQFGWEFMGQMASCFIWRKEYTGERPESFTDQDSLTRRNKRVRNAVLACFLIALLGLIGAAVGMAVHAAFQQYRGLYGLAPAFLICLFFVLYLSWVLRKISRNLSR